MFRHSLVRATCAVAAVALLAGCSGASARGAGAAFWFVAVVGFLFSVGILAVVGYLFVRLASTLWSGEAE
ncbi:MAG: hypothetical protein ABEH47_03920 [Haloferacaceae archaeon]